MARDSIITNANLAWQEQVYTQVRKQVWYLRHPVLTPATHLQHDLQLDLLERVQLGIRLEYSLTLEFPDTEIGQWQTLADVLACVQRHLPAAAAQQGILTSCRS
jgi:acyl carrier protein